MSYYGGRDHARQGPSTSRNYVGNQHRQKDTQRYKDNVQDSSRKVAVRTNYVRRPGWAANCESVAILTNFFALNLNVKKVYMYTVDIVVGSIDGGGKFMPRFKPNERRMNKTSSDNHRQVLDQLHEKYSVPGSVFHDDDRSRPLLFAYDGAKTFFTTKALPTKRTDLKTVINEVVTIEIAERKVLYEVVVKFSGTVDMECLTKQTIDSPDMTGQALKALDIILLSELSKKRLIYGHGIFHLTDRSSSRSISKAKEVNFGHFQTAKYCAAGPLINIDRFTATFYSPGDLSQLIINLMSPEDDRVPVNQFFENQISDMGRFSRRLLKMLLGVKVATTHMSYRKTFKIKEITNRRADEIEFEANEPEENGKKKYINVVQYFETTYKRKIMPFAPCIRTGSKQRPVYYPLDVLLVEKNASIAPVRDEENLELIRICSKATTEQRFEIIKKSVEGVKKDSLAVLHEFEIDLATDPVEVEAKVVNHPVLHFGDGVSWTPSSGRWEMNDKKVYHSEVIDNWCVIKLSKNTSERAVSLFLKEMFAEAKSMGIKLRKPESSPRRYRWRDDENIWSCDGEHLVAIFEEIKLTFACKPNLVLFVIEEKNDDMYREIKYLGEVKHGVNTQCITDNNINADRSRKKYDGIVPNMLLKINTKLDGVNCYAITSELIGLNGKTMFIGADVTHPNKGETIQSSIAAITASYDSKSNFYKASVRAQVGSEEIILEMEDMVLELFDGYVERNSKQAEVLPDHIIFYRDGVSDGMFAQVMEQEVGQMKRAFRQFQTKNGELYKPKLTFIIVQKRHHTRFIPKDIKQGVGHGVNVPSGTVVDQKVVHPHDFDFYLCSQESAFGTCRPTHYYVLQDDNSFTADQLYKLTFGLCHSYATATRAISIPAPVQYAHLAAFRARHHLKFSNAEREFLQGRLGQNCGRMSEWSKLPDAKRRAIGRDISEWIQVRKETTFRMYFI
ncbi:Protein argonaute-3 [Halotydeus destructor]|nr:Protein argonaute-3 [Halotydeus destructor]